MHARTTETSIKAELSKIPKSAKIDQTKRLNELLQGIKNVKLEIKSGVSIDISPLKNIEELNLWGQKILPKGISQLQKLKVLNLENCELSQWPEELKSLKNLENLNLAHNLLFHIPESIFSLTKLKSLNMRGISSMQYTEMKDRIKSEFPKVPEKETFKLNISEKDADRLNAMPALSKLIIDCSNVDQSSPGFLKIDRKKITVEV